MKWRIFFRPEIRGDLADASRWYDEQKVGLGREFIAEVIAVFQLLEANPKLNSPRSRRCDVRWRLTKRFPYRIVYQMRETEDILLVLAVLHAARHDRHWQGRLDTE